MSFSSSVDVGNVSYWWFFAVHKDSKRFWENLMNKVNKIWMKIWLKWTKSLSWNALKKFSRPLQNMTNVCKHLFRIISIRRNKRDDHTTLGSTFSIGNVSYWVFSTGFNGSKWIWKSFLLILVDFCTKSEKNEKSVWLWAIKKMVGESFQDMTSVWKHFFRIIAIRRNKRYDHTTLGSIFNVGNVSYWWFFHGLFEDFLRIQGLSKSRFLSSKKGPPNET